MDYTAGMSLVKNKKVHHEYEIIKTYEAGMVLLGSEVKSIKIGNASLDGSYCVVRGGSVFILNTYIPPYQKKNTKENYDPYRVRELLLQKKEILILADEEKSRGLTIIPICIYNKGGILKIEIASARKLKKYDKRQLLKKREDERKINNIKRGSI